MQPASRLIVFILDSSESMGSRARISAAKGTILALLGGAYRRRDRVALIAFHDGRSVLVLPPTRSVLLAREKLHAVVPRGATPLSAGLLEGLQLIRRETAGDPSNRPLLVLLSDGEANVPLVPGVPCEQELLALARRIGAERVGMERILTITIDTGKDSSGGRLLHSVADAMQGQYHRSRHPDAAEIVSLLDPGTEHGRREVG